MISSGAVTDYAWDNRNRLTSVTERASAAGPALRITTYKYDALDRRIAKLYDSNGDGNSDRTDAWVWDGAHEILQYRDSDGVGAAQSFRLTNRYLWGDAIDQLLADEQYTGNGGPVVFSAASATAGNTLWALADQLGSVRDLVDNNGVIRQHVVYDGFGRRVREVDYNSSGVQIANNDPSAIDELFGYTGRDWDSDTQLQYNRARWYDPATGRWLSQDPIGFSAGDANLYRYVGNHPTYARDPSGLQEPVDPETNGRPWYDKRPFSFDMDAHAFQRWHLRLEAGEYWTYRRGCVGLAGIRISNNGLFPHVQPGARAFGSYQDAMAALASIEAANGRGMLIAYQDTNPIITSFPPVGTYPSSTEFDPETLPLGDYNFASLVELHGTAYWEWIDSEWEARNSMFYPDPKDDPFQNVGRDVHHCRMLPIGYHGKLVNTIYLVVPTARDIDKGRDGQGKEPRYRRGSPVYPFPPSIAPPSTTRPQVNGGE